MWSNFIITQHSEQQLHEGWSFVFSHVPRNNIGLLYYFQDKITKKKKKEKHD